MRRLSVALAVISAVVAGVDGGMGDTLAGAIFIVSFSYKSKVYFLSHFPVRRSTACQALNCLGPGNKMLYRALPQGEN
jgi:hypothetical protein